MKKSKSARSRGPVRTFIVAPHERAVVGFVKQADEAAQVPQIASILGLLRGYLLKNGPSIDEDFAACYRVVGEVARVLNAEDMDVAARGLDRIDKEWSDPNNGREFASDLACKRWTPELDAAMIVGFAMGNMALLIDGGAQ